MHIEVRLDPSCDEENVYMQSKTTVHIAVAGVFSRYWLNIVVG